MLISMATLTGAARVAVGPDLAPYYSDDEAMVAALEPVSYTHLDVYKRQVFMVMMQLSLHCARDGKHPTLFEIVQTLARLKQAG